MMRKTKDNSINLNFSVLKEPILNVIDKHLIEYPVPSNLNYFWGFGSLAGFCLVVQIGTGIFLACHYTPDVDLAFSSVEHIVRDVRGGFLLRNVHANGASLFFIVTFLHMLRGLYYGSYQSPRELVWIIGVLMLFLMIATSFMGYSLPFGQQSLWGISVITSLFSVVPVVGVDLVHWLWGGFSVNNATLNRFFALHFLLPFLIVGASIVHIAALHQKGANCPLGINHAADKVNLYPKLVYKDRVGLMALLIVLSVLVWFAPNVLAHPDNSIPANSLVTPLSITPEWYFCAPMRHYDRRQDVFSTPTLDMRQGQYRCQNIYCKTYRPGVRENAYVRSGGKSNVSRVGFCEKLLQVKPGTVKIINLNDTHPVRPYTLATHLLTRKVSHSKFPESKACFMTMGSRDVTQTFMGQGPKPGIDVHNGTLGFPKADSSRRGASYGNGSAVKESLTPKGALEGRKDDRVRKDTLITNSGEELSNLYKRNASQEGNQTVNGGVIHVISSLDTLMVAYETLKSKPGNMTPGPNKKETLDGTSLRTLELLSKKLKSGKFKFGSARRIMIPKPGKLEKRPLTIPSPREKIVQKAIQLALEGIYEPYFLPSSHGFRPGRGTHTARLMIDQQCKNANWFIEADISKCFDTMDHGTLMGFISERITCDKTKALILSALEAGYARAENGLAQKDLGIPQGSVLSPILCNIYMHKLDLLMEGLMQKYNKGKSRKRNPAYTKLANALAKTTELSERRQIRTAMRQIPIGDPMDPNMIRVKYVRYADDFICSVIGPYNLARLIKSEVEEFLEQTLKLKVNHAKSVITNTKRKPAKFLGTRIRTGKSSSVQKPIGKAKTGRKTRLTPRVSLHAPIDEIFQKLKIRGFIKSGRQNSSAIPTAVGRLVNMDHADIVAYYNRVSRGILNDYSFADNHKSLGSVIRALHMSCARTLALKYKLRFAAKVFKTFGKHLKDPDSKKLFELPETYRRKRVFQAKVPLALKTLEKSWSNKLTKSGLNRSCTVCGAMPVEMHHVKRIKELKQRTHLNWFTMQMAAINRKQVPLCREHHKK
jgi:ubiquinol-cytochrome c reductase cytochrome b subunit